MIVVECTQRSTEWYDARRGVVTASEFDRILTPVELKKSTQANAYRWRLLAEWMTGKSYEGYSNKATERGLEFEAEARSLYRFLTDKDVQEVGFVYRDDERLLGCSPDGVIRDGVTIIDGVEIKCPDPHTHIGYLLGRIVPREYVLQIQGSMFVTGAKSWDFLSYHPDLPPFLLTVRREDRILSALDAALDDFITTMLHEREILRPRDTKEALESSLKVLQANQ